MDAVLQMALGVVADAAAAEMKQSGKTEASFPANAALSVDMWVTVTLKGEVPDYEVLDVTSGDVPSLPDGSVVRREDGMFLQLAGEMWQQMQVESRTTDPMHEPGERWMFRTRGPIVPQDVDTPAETPHGPCPLGKSPCHMAAPQCTVSPGLFVVMRDGRQFNVCGNCLNEMGAEVIGSARSLR